MLELRATGVLLFSSYSNILFGLSRVSMSGIHGYTFTLPGNIIEPKEEFSSLSGIFLTPWTKPCLKTNRKAGEMTETQLRGKGTGLLIAPSKQFPRILPENTLIINKDQSLLTSWHLLTTSHFLLFHTLFNIRLSTRSWIKCLYSYEGIAAGWLKQETNKHRSKIFFSFNLKIQIYELLLYCSPIAFEQTCCCLL